ncbi:copper resistance protein CopC [Iamia majanohamensis]|uniref:Copper resistance protein CopC n=1 Tax=Iamia majanohamensis TaxID=467976 RepID=A0AAE9YBK1_9ACTN|nr:copper resistance protein CopC [Iamia majanohamensis]WCO68009.1 copper resistance protein CopC [Iamia majanohamensis]
MVRPLSRGRVGRLALGIVVCVGAVLAGGAAPAGAHSFLVSTSPSQGQRLGASPDALVLEFSEAVDLSSVLLEVRDASGSRVREPDVELNQDGLGVRADVEALDEGIYTVTWEALSAVDGHGSTGEFAFAVGDVAGSVPVGQQSEPLDRWSLVSSWLFTGGLGAALGALVLWGIGVTEVDLPRRVGRPALVVALGGVALSAARAGAGVTASVITGEALLAALVLIGLRLPRRWPAGSLVVAGGAWAATSHGAASGPLGWAVDAVHLVAGAAWFGSLILVLVVVVVQRRRGRPWVPTVERYAGPAMSFVVVLGLAGAVSAARLLPTWSTLWTTGYGRLVTVKVVLFTLALAAAATARWRGLRRPDPMLLRRTMAFEVVLVATAMLVAGALRAGAPPSPVGSAERLLGPPPLGLDLARDAGLAGQLNVEVVSNGEILEIDVFGPSGPISGTETEVVVTGPDGTTVDLTPRPCGTGCLTQSIDLERGETTVEVSATASELTGGSFTGTLQWPSATRAPDRLERMIEVMSSVPELTVTETVDSGPGSMVSPANLATTGPDLIASEPYAAGNLEQVWVRPGEPERLTFYVPGSQIFGDLTLDATGRMATARLVTPGHLITRTFTYP